MTKQLNITEFMNSLEGDVWVKDITVLPDMAQVRDYTLPRQPFVRRDFTVVTWSHDGVHCVDVFITLDGCIPIYGDYEDDDIDELFMAVYNAPHASLRINDEIPESLSTAFLATATERMDYTEWW